MRALLEALAKVLSLLPERWAFDRARWVLSETRTIRARINQITDEMEALRSRGTESDTQRADQLRNRLKDECADLERVSALSADASPRHASPD